MSAVHDDIERRAYQLWQGWSLPRCVSKVDWEQGAELTTTTP